MKRPILEVFAISWNEASTIERLIKWYRARIPDCRITILDNMSTDDTSEVCERLGARMIQFGTNGKMDEGALIDIRNNVWKNSPASFVIMCDSDELIDVTERDLLDCNDGEVWNLCRCQGVELFGTDEDNGEFWGIESEGYCKSILFHAPSASSMNFAPGSHTCQPAMAIGVTQKWSPVRFPLYHTKWQNWNAGVKRQHEIMDKGLSEESKLKGWNFHYALPDSDHEQYFQNGYKNRRKFL